MLSFGRGFPHMECVREKNKNISRRQVIEGLESHRKHLKGLDSLSGRVDNTEDLQDIECCDEKCNYHDSGRNMD